MNHFCCIRVKILIAFHSSTSEHPISTVSEYTNPPPPPPPVPTNGNSFGSFFNEDKLSTTSSAPTPKQQQKQQPKQVKIFEYSKPSFRKPIKTLQEQKKERDAFYEHTKHKKPTPGNDRIC